MTGLAVRVFSCQSSGARFTTIMPKSISTPLENADSPGLVEESAFRSEDAFGSDAESTDNGELVVLQQRLGEKEKLVAVLTQRLEQAAEQLDRYQRSGADRHLVSGSGIPAELVDQQQTLVENLQRAIDRWEDMQAAATLGRLEMQISELRDLVAGNLTVVVQPGDQETCPSHTPSVSEPRQENVRAKNVPTQTESGWESLKASLLSDEAASDDDEAITDDRPVDIDLVPVADLSRQQPVENSADGANVGDGATAPDPVDPELADPEQLHAAIDERDGYINYLLKRLRYATPIDLPEDWSDIENVSEAQRQRLESLNKMLEEKLRLAEVEFSVERARLSREERQLKQLEQQLDKDRRRAGNSANAVEDDESDPINNRWLKFLGRGSKAPSADHPKGNE